MQENYPAPGSGATVMHRLDPRTKLALLLMSFVAAVLPERPEMAGLAAALVLAQTALARAWPYLYRCRWLLLVLSLFTVAAWSLLARVPTPLFCSAGSRHFQTSDCLYSPGACQACAGRAAS